MSISNPEKPENNKNGTKRTKTEHIIPDGPGDPVPGNWVIPDGPDGPPQFIEGGPPDG